MKSEKLLSQQSSSLALREKPLGKPKTDRSLERRTKQVKKQRITESKTTIVSSRAASPSQASVIMSHSSKQSLKYSDKQLTMSQKPPAARDPPNILYQTQYVPISSQQHQAVSPQRLGLSSDNQIGRRSGHLAVHPLPILQSHFIPGSQLPQIVTTHNINIPQVASTQSIHIPTTPQQQTGYSTQSIHIPLQQSMTIKTSRNIEQRAGQKEEILKSYKQSIDDKEGRIRNYEVRINSLQGRLEDHDLEKKANVILTSFITEISLYFSREEMSLDELRTRILATIQQNQRLAKLLQSFETEGRTKEQKLMEELQRIIEKYDEAKFKHKEMELNLFEISRDNNTKTREIEQLRTKVLELQSHSPQSASFQSVSRVELDTEVKNLKSLNISLEKEIEFLRGRLGVANLPSSSSSLSQKEFHPSNKNLEYPNGSIATTNSSPVETELLRAKVLALQIQLQGRNQEIMILGQRIKALEEERQGPIGKSIDSLSYSLETYDKDQRFGGEINQSNIRRVKEEDNASSAIKIINSLSMARNQQNNEEQYQNILFESGMKDKPIQYLQEPSKIGGSDPSKSSDQPKKSSFAQFDQSDQSQQLELVHQNSSKSNIHSEDSRLVKELDKYKVLDVVNQQLRQRIIELQNQNAYTVERLKAQLSVSGDKQQMTRKNEELKDAKLKLQLKIIGLEKQNAQIQGKVREMWEIHKRQVEAERDKVRVQTDTLKQKQMILKARIHELEDAVNSIGDKRMVAESGSRNISDYQNRYKEMEDELVNVQNYKMRLNDMQMEMNRLFQDNEELRKELIARQSENNIFKQQLEGMSTAKRLLEDQLGLPAQTKSRTSSVNPAQPNKQNEVNTFSQQANTVETGAYPETKADSDQLLGEYREQLESFNERVNLLTVENNRLRSSEHTLKIDTQTLKRHLQQMGNQKGMLIKELDQARQRNEKVYQLEVELEEYKNKLQTYKLRHEDKSFRSDDVEPEILMNGESMQELIKSSEHTHAQKKNIEQDVNILSEQLKFAQQEIITRQNNQEQLTAQLKSEIRRLQDQCKVYKESAQGRVNLSDENELWRQQLKKEKKEVYITQFTQYQDQQREIISQLNIKIEEDQLTIWKLQQQNSFLSEQLKYAEQQMKVLKQAQNEFREAESRITNQSNLTIKTYEERTNTINKEIETVREQNLRLRQSEIQAEQNSKYVEQVNKQNIQMLNRTIQEYHQKYQQKEEQLISMKSSFDQLDKNRQELIGDIELINNECSNIRNSQDALRKNIQELAKINSDLNNKNMQDAEKYVRELNQERSSRTEAIMQIQQDMHQQQSEKIMRLQQEMSSQLTNLLKENQTLKSQIIVLTSSLEQYKDKAIQLTVLQTKLNQTKQQFARMDTHFRSHENQLIAKISELELHNQELKQTNSRLFEENSVNARNLADEKSEIQKLERMFRDAEHVHLDKISQLEGHIETLRKSESITEQRTEQLEYHLKEKVKQLNQIESRQQEHLNRIAEMETATEHLQLVLNKKQEYMKYQFEIIQSENQTLKRDNYIFMETLHMNDSGKERENQHSYVLEDLQIKISTLNNQNNELKLKEISQVERLCRMEASEKQMMVANKQMRGQISQMATNIEYLNSIIRELQQQLDQQERQLAKLHSLKERNNIQQLPEYKQMIERISSYEQVNRSLEQENHSVQLLNERLTMQMAELSQQYEYIAAEKERLERRLSQEPNVVQVHSQFISQSSTSINQPLEPNNKLAAQLKKLNQHCNYLTAEKEKLQNTVSELNIYLNEQAAIINHPAYSLNVQPLHTGSEDTTKLTIQIQKLGQHCQYLSNEKAKLEQKISELTFQFQQQHIKTQLSLTQPYNESSLRLSQQLDNINRNYQQLSREKQSLVEIINELNRKLQNQTTNRSNNIRPTIQFNNNNNERLARQLSQLSRHHDYLYNENNRLIQKVNELDNLLRQQKQQPPKITSSIPTNNMVQYSNISGKINAQLVELNQHCEYLSNEKRRLEQIVGELNTKLIERNTINQRNNVGIVHSNVTEAIQNENRLMKEQIKKMTELLQNRTEQTNRVHEDNVRTANELASSQHRSNNLALRLKSTEQANVQLLQKLEVVSTEHQKMKQFMEDMRRTKSNEAGMSDIIHKELQVQGSLLSNDAQKMLISSEGYNRNERQMQCNTASNCDINMVAQPKEREIIRLNKLNNELKNQINFLSNEKEALHRQLELKYQECNSVKLNLEHLQMVNRQLVDQLKEYMRSGVNVNESYQPQSRYFLPESIKESKSSSQSVNASEQATNTKQLDEELRQMQNILQEERSLTQHLKHQNDVLNQQRTELEFLINSLKKENQVLHTQLNTFKRDLNESTDYSLQQSIRILKINISDKETQLNSIKEEMSQFIQTMDSEKSKWSEQIKALRQIGLDLERENSELLERNTQLESRLRITQADSFNLKQERLQVQQDKATKSEHFKKELDNIIDQIKNKALDGSNRMSTLSRMSVRSNEPAPFRQGDTPEPKKPRILRNKSPDLREDESPKDNKFNNPFDDNKERQPPTLMLQSQPISQSVSQPMQSLLSFLQGQQQKNSTKDIVTSGHTTLIPITGYQNQSSQRLDSTARFISQKSQSSQLSTPANSHMNQKILSEPDLQIIKQLNISKSQQPTNSQQPQSKIGSPNPINTIVSMKTVQENSSGKRVSSSYNSSSQSNVHFVRVTELSRNKPDQSIGLSQMITVNNPRTSQGPTQFVKKSVIINKGDEPRLIDQTNNQKFSSSDIESSSNLGLYSSPKLPDADNPYFSKVGQSDKPRTSSASNRRPVTNSQIRMLKVETPLQGLRSSRTSAQVTSNIQESDYFRSRQEFLQMAQPVVPITKMQQLRPKIVTQPQQMPPNQRNGEISYSVSTSRSSSVSSLPGMNIYQQQFARPTNCCFIGKP